MQFEQVYLHRCYDNELGFRNNAAGKAGRFFLISKNVATFFPHLSNTQLNDNVLIRLVSSDNTVISLCNYVFHNSKYASINPNEKRNEYRIYFNTDLDTNGNLFKPGDIISFTKYFYEKEYYYKLHHYSEDKPSEEQNTIRTLMINEGNHLLVDLPTVPFLRKPLEIENADTILTKKNFEKAISLTLEDNNIQDKNENENKDNEIQIKELDTEEIEHITIPNAESKLIRSNTFRDLVLFAYENKCAITRKSIEFKSLLNLEAAHIQPDSHKGPNIVTNGVALGRDLHWAFDKGFFTIKKDGENYFVEVHEKAKENEIMMSIEGKELFKPQDNRFRIKDHSLLYHQENIYGTFKQIRTRIDL